MYPRILWEAREVIAEPLAMIFAPSVETGEVPEDWRIADVVPIFKKGNRDSPGNYRPTCLILLLVLNLQIIVCCGPAEYLNDGECCSMCSPGTIVFKHCTRDFGTTCKPCTGGEYIEHPNGLEKCLKCKVCDRELGLQVKHACSYTRNTICGPREGYYCIDSTCQMGRKHKTCPPGERVAEKGTQFEDTVCEVCPEGTYSNNDSSTQTCEKWTVCKEINKKQVTLGTATADTVCEEKSHTGIIAAVIVPVLLIIAGAVLVYFCKKNREQSLSTDNRHGEAEMGQPSGQTLLEKSEKIQTRTKQQHPLDEL